MPKVQQIALETNQPRLVAKQELEDAMSGKISLSSKSVYDLAMRVYKDEDVAEQYRNAIERRSWTT